MKITIAQSHNLKPYKDKFAHTYSIVAYDKKTGEMGVAVQFHWFSVGSLVTWAEAGVGAIATQSFVNPDFGPQGLALLKTGLSAKQVLKALIESDEGRDVRQLAVVDAKGNAAAYTGEKCIEAAGHIIGDGYSVQANLMKNDKVWGAMSKAYEAAKDQPLAERMMAALEAAQEVGGDIRGKQSAAMLVVKAKSTGKSWQDKAVDLRVEDHKTPIKELKRLLKTHRAYEHMNNGDVAMEEGDIDKAIAEYSAAEKLFPENEEMKYWHAVNLVNAGRIEESLPLFKIVFAKNKDWKTLTPRLIKNGLLKADEKALKKILAHNVLDKIITIKIMNLQPTLENDLLILKPLSENEFEALYEIAKDPLIWQQHPSYDRYQKEVYSDFFNDSIQSKGALIVIDKSNNQIIGSSRFKPIQHDNNAIEIGWSFLARNYWGGKFNRSLKKLMIDYAFETIHNVVFYVDKNNIRSQKAVEKIGGIRIEGTINQHLMNQNEADWTYRINKENWKY